MNELLPLLNGLSKRRNSHTVFNPYRDEQLLNNLRVYIEQVLKQESPRILLVGEAYGFRGGRLTGIPFSSGCLYDDVDHPFLESLKPLIYRSANDLVAENTASIVWRYLQDKPFVPLFWNSFPFHPHPSRVQRKNRAPNVSEIKEGIGYLRLLCDLYQPDLIAGLGRKGAESIQRAFPKKEIIYIRHPSYGGKKEFISGMDSLYRLVGSG